MTVMSIVSFGVLLFVLLFHFDFEGFNVHIGEKPHIKRPSWSRDSQEYVLPEAWDTNAPPQKRYYNWTLSEISGNPDGNAFLSSSIFGFFFGTDP